MAPHRNKTDSLTLDDGRSYFLASAFMSQNQEVRLLMRPPTWSALPLFGSGTKTRISVPAVIPKTGDTYRRHKHTNGVAAVGQWVYWGKFCSPEESRWKLCSQLLCGFSDSTALSWFRWIQPAPSYHKQQEVCRNVLGKNKRMSHGVL